MAETNLRPVLVEEVEASDPLDRFVDGILGEEPEGTPEPEEAISEEPAEESTPVKEEAEQAEPEEPEYVEIRHNGKPVKLKLDEVIEHAQKGFDYTQKTQELAEQRRNLEQYAQELTRQQEFQQQFQQDYAQISAMDMQLQQFRNVDWSGYTDQNPVEATKAWQRFQILQQQRNELESGLRQKAAQMQQENAARRDAILHDANQALQNEFGDKWNAETRKELLDVGVRLGYSQEQLRGISSATDVRALMMLRDYFKIIDGKAAVQKKVSEAPKLAKPGTKPVQAENVQRKQLVKALKTSQSRKTREAAAMSLLDDFIR